MSITLRPIIASDSERLLTWRNSTAVSAHMYADHSIGQIEHARWFEAALVAEDRVYWVIEHDRAPVGLANLAQIDPIRRRCDWAFYLGEAGARGRGVGAAVAFLVIEHVFSDLGFNKLCCEVLLENAGVWRLHESFGFQREALFRDHIWKAGRFQDVVGLGLLAADWGRTREGCAARLSRAGHGPETLKLTKGPTS